MKKIDCKKYADEILDQVKQIPDKKKRLVIFTAGKDPASEAYMKGKMKDCEYCGIPCEQIRVKIETELLFKLELLNYQSSIGGIIVQLPLPRGFDEQAILDAVRFTKDVDGFKPNSPFLPCTPEGILYILEKEIGDLTGKTVLLLGKGKLIGKPLIDLLLERGCTLTVMHSKTTKEDFRELLKTHHDIVITGVGKANLVDLKQTSAKVVIDAGITRNKEGKLCGDCFNFDDTGRGMKVTTVPNGIGLMTRAMLMKHMGMVNEK